MAHSKISIDQLIEIVRSGGKIKTGVDVYNQNGVLLLEQDVLVDSVNILENIKKNGISNLPIFPRNAGGLWDKNGDPVDVGLPEETEEVKSVASSVDSSVTPDVEHKLSEINRLKKEATENYKKAKVNIKKVLDDIQDTGGRFDYEIVEDTVSDLLCFLTENENGFSYLTKEIFSYDDYLHNHSVNVCTIGTAILSRFNRNFSESVNQLLANDVNADSSFKYYHESDIRDISAGFFLHDIGKVLIPDSILNKKGKLTDEEFDVVRKHSFEKGLEILEKNNIDNPIIKNIVKYHHSVLFNQEKGCYPPEKPPIELPAYVKVCKLADIYDAMTSKRSYKEAFNPINVVTEIFRKYAQKDNLLQYILYSFVKSIGIYPPGSVVMLLSGQYAYVLDSSGPIVIPFTDDGGITMGERQAAIDLGTLINQKVDSNKPLLSPLDAFEILPDYLKDFAV